MTRITITVGKLETRPHCPACRALLDGYTHAGDEAAQPSPGDASVCAYCTAILTYELGAHGMRLRLATDAEQADAMENPILQGFMDGRKASGGEGQ